MNMKYLLKQSICIVTACLLVSCMFVHPLMAEPDASQKEDSTSAGAENILAGMTLDEKISQMIIPAIRTWNNENVTDLSKVPELAEALKKHQYGGIILFGTNVVDSEQLVRLVSDLQSNNASIEKVSANIPYFMPLDEEGGIVTRLTMGTRMTGSMAIGATGEHAAENAVSTGRVIGEELAALGFNIDFAPVIDVNNNAANPVIGTRSFSDDPQVVSQLGQAYAQGLAQNHIIATYKHFPGHGDTGTDSHIGTPSVNKTYDQILETELVPFEAAIAGGADLIMTAHITYPLIDVEEVFGDGETKGYYPTTMSKKMITDILRNNMGFDGVVITDALEMGAIETAHLVPGEEGSVEYRVNIAEKVINAGVDILLLPLDMTNADAVNFYDDYIAGLEQKVTDAEISMEQIDAAVLRILKLKEKYGILEASESTASVEEVIENAVQSVGSVEHHNTEMEIARQAVTLLKNADNLLPAQGTGQKIVFVGRQPEDSVAILHAIKSLQEDRLIDPDAQIINNTSNETTGSEDAATKITIDYYYNPSGEETKLHYTDQLKAAIREADLVICLTKTFNLNAMEKSSDQYLGIAGTIADTREGGGKVVIISDNLPYDAARYQDADAILLAYMGSGLDIDPTVRNNDLPNKNAYNANVNAAISILFGSSSPEGTLPVNIPAIEEQEDGSLLYSESILYERGYGLTY